MSQEQLARAVALHGGRKVSKPLVSQWESDRVRNPENANLFAIQAATGFRAEWISSGEGSPKTSTQLQSSVHELDRECLRQALMASAKVVGMNAVTAAQMADMSGRLYSILMEALSPLDETTLVAIAKELAKPS